MNDGLTDALREALDRLYRRTAHGILPDLEIITRLLDRLGHPERSVPRVHAAGTNGKGSVCAMVESVLRHAGYTTGLYTSPHLLDFNERIRLNGAPIANANLHALLERIEPMAEQVAAAPGHRPATFFEMATVLAYAAFEEARTDWAVVETGMGGRWDATNVGAPAIAVITKIDVDHIAYLSADIRKIAWEKAGIIKSGAPVICGTMSPEVESVVLNEAKTVGATVVRADQAVRIRRLRHDWFGQKLSIETDQHSYRPILLPLIGRHQIENCALAVAVLETLDGLGRIQLTEETLAAGLSNARWPARCQILSRDPVVLLDAAHNPNGAAALTQTLMETAKGQPVFLIAGFLEDKDADRCMTALARVATHCWAVPVQHDKGMSPDRVRASAERAGITTETATLDDGMKRARERAARDDGVVCIAGSLYLAGEVLSKGV